MISRAGVLDADYLALESEAILRGLPEYKDCPFELKHTAEMFRTYFSLDCIGCFFSEDEHGCTGFIMAQASAPFYSPQVELHEMFFWVREDKRGSKLAVSLIKTIEEWGNVKNAVKKFLSIGTGMNTEQVEKLYNRLGYRTVGRITCKEG